MEQTKKMCRSNTLDLLFDNITNDIENEIMSPPPTTTVGNTTHYEKRTTENEGEGTLSTTKQTTTLVINIKKPITEDPITAITEEELNCAEGEHPEEAPCSACKKSDFPTLFFPTVGESAETTSFSSAEGNIDGESSDDTLSFTDADKALDSMLDDICKLTAESFYDDKEDNRRSIRSSGSFTARKRWSRLKPSSLTEEQKIRLSIAHIVDGKQEGKLLDDLMDENELEEEGKKE